MKALGKADVWPLGLGLPVRTRSDLCLPIGLESASGSARAGCACCVQRSAQNSRVSGSVSSALEFSARANVVIIGKGENVQEKFYASAPSLSTSWRVCTGQDVQ